MCMWDGRQGHKTSNDCLVDTVVLETKDKKVGKIINVSFFFVYKVIE